MNQDPEALDALANDVRNGVSKVPFTCELPFGSPSAWSVLWTLIDEDFGYYSPEMGGILLGYEDYNSDSGVKITSWSLV